MTYCFICMLNSGINICSQCNIRVHLKCWGQYIEYKYNNGGSLTHTECPQCKFIIH